MKLFIDTSNKKFILALINNENIVNDFFMVDTNNDVVKNSVSFIKEFLTKSKVKLEEIDGYMMTVGPGSFTGVKVSYNIINTLNLVDPVRTIETIDTFKLLKDKDKRYVAIRFGKSKFYVKDFKNALSKVKVLNNLEDTKIKLEQVAMDYDNFSKEKLQSKISEKQFKLLDNLGKAKIKYLTNY